ncbi:MAG: nitrous oxide-stimulated promoter family protein [Desulfobacterota bacterium]|nr:nitrous oxide-stimulated promoter family protein [Thermodesulfobacteriota bacterium]
MVKKEGLSQREKEDIRTLMRFVEIYCRENHDGERAPFSFRLYDLKTIHEKEIFLCPDCQRLLTYGLTMRLRCPYDPKPMCKKCQTQCYKGDYKEKIRKIMKFSGMYLIKHGRVDLLFHYLK